MMLLRKATLACAIGAALLLPLPTLAGHGHGGHGHGEHGRGHGGHGHGGHAHAHAHHDHHHHGHGHGGMAVGEPMASAPAGVGHHMVMSGSAGTDYPLRPSGLPGTMSRQSRLLRIQYAAITAMKNDMRSAMHAMTAIMVA